MTARNIRIGVALGAAVLLPALVFVPSAQARADESSSPLALEALHNYALCAVKRTPEGAAKMLARDPTSEDFKRARMRFGKGHAMCAKNGDVLRSNAMLFAGSVAEALIAKYPQRSLTAAAQKHIQPRNMIEGVGMCVAAQKPAEVEAVFATEPGSDAERVALNPTASLLPGCVTPGKTIKLNRPAARAIYALGAYRLLAGTPEHPEG